MRVRSFPPVSAPAARLLVLGSMPGKASLEADQYYAHPRNAFWPIIADLFGVATDRPYHDRLATLTAHGIALWDVLGSCERESSLDADIRDRSIVVNDFAAFLSAYPTIDTVCFNGAKAEQVFRRRVLPTLPADALTLYRLPSTSPANASIRYAEKLAAWSLLRDHAERSLSR